MKWILALCACAGISCQTGDPDRVAINGGRTPHVDADKAVEEFNATKRGLELLAMFPPPKWNPLRAVSLSSKKRDGKPITQEEERFLKNYILWTVGHSYHLKAMAEIKETKEKNP